ncbi:MAG: hypothetical protein EXR72_02370 [Myxococcales bacterium]|nr:hypothetical protein [Myxococcales bacterium]
MTARSDLRTRDRLASPVVLFYWLLLVGGLGLFTALRRDEAGVVAPLWAGAIAGTALGQILALRNLRLWIAALLIVAVPLFVAPFIPYALEAHLWMAWLPAAFCGYWSLGDRLGLAAFWFPSVIWMLTILDHVHVNAGASSLRDGLDSGAGVLLAGLALLFLAFLRAREYRRVGLWRAVAAVPLATTHAGAVLREAPGRSLARVCWLVMVGGLTFGITAWVAPHLWKQEKLPGGHVAVAGDGFGPAGEGGGLPCCPAAEVATERSRVREYFDLVRGHDDEAPAVRPGVDCRACDRDGALAFGGAGGGTATVAAAPFVASPSPPAGLRPRSVSAPAAPIAAPPVPPDPIVPPPSSAEPPSAPPPAAPHAVQKLPEAPAARPVAPPPTNPNPAPAPRSIRRPPPREARPDLLRWLLTLAGAALLFSSLNTALRPLRRLIALRHLRRPYWAESVDQRVSNFWQLALVGLRDAGWRPTSGEPPRQFARRVGVEGMETCATILERARHGLGIDAGDLDTMSEAATRAYRTSRGRLNLFARAVAWLRWPLA